MASRRSTRSALLALAALTAALGLSACLPRGHVEVSARASGEPGLATALGGARLAQYRGAGDGTDDGNRLGDTLAGADDDSRAAAQLASATGTPYVNDVARRVRYNGAYFEVDVEADDQRGQRGIVPVTWSMLRAFTPLTDDAYYARVYTSRGWAAGRQAPGFGPAVILPEAFTPELTPVIFEYFAPSFIGWNRNFNGWTQGMADAWVKAAVIHVARSLTPGATGGVAVARASITGQRALGAPRVRGAAGAIRACSRGSCPASETAGGLSAARGAGTFGARSVGAAQAPIKLTGRARRLLRGIRDLKDVTVREAIRARGGSARVVREAGDEFAGQFVGNVANAAARGDPNADKVIKLIKEARRLGEKF